MYLNFYSSSHYKFKLKLLYSGVSVMLHWTNNLEKNTLVIQ